MTHHEEDPTTYVGHGITGASRAGSQVTLRTPAELADALPYLLGYRPDDSIVLVALHDREQGGRFGGRARLGIPAQCEDWAAAARQLAHGLVWGSERRGARPESMVAYLVQDPGPGETGRDVMERLRPLAQLLRTTCGSLDVAVVEALCIADGRFWSYCCPSPGCCPVEGNPMGLPGTSVLAAAATYAGIQVRGSLRDLRARLEPWETAAALEQETALDAAGAKLVPRILDGVSRDEVEAETLDMARKLIGRFTTAVAEAEPGKGTSTGTLSADCRDDELIGHEEAAAVILGLQDRTTRDRAAAWMEGDEAAPALRLWRALARRCVGPYREHAAAPLTLAGWVAWSSGDELEAREALAMAMGADPDYLFARLLHQACNEGLDPETIRNCLRGDRDRRENAGPDATAPHPTDGTGGAGGTDRADEAIRTDAPIRTDVPIRAVTSGGTVATDNGMPAETKDMPAQTGGMSAEPEVPAPVVPAPVVSVAAPGVERAARRRHRSTRGAATGGGPDRRTPRPGAQRRRRPTGPATPTEGHLGLKPTAAPGRGTRTDRSRERGSAVPKDQGAGE
ncbi:DUF4192 domain-containing protein [Streptomyces griseoaurantiacus]|uniref:DUF4192 domain-containing protein n=1 Tax=Streptomyces griseoaurantiacus TaxID=68213 RepID=UPI002ED60744|nr:DUF4192 domain-containing protein [Streptomyces jietaisiensis]